MNTDQLDGREKEKHQNRCWVRLKLFWSHFNANARAIGVKASPNSASCLGAYPATPGRAVTLYTPIDSALQMKQTDICRRDQFSAAGVQEAKLPSLNIDHKSDKEQYL